MNKNFLSGLRVKEGGGLSGIANASSSSNPVNILVDGFGQVIIDDVLHAADVQTSGSDVCGHDDVHAAGLEVAQSHLALSLQTIAMNRGGRKSLWKNTKILKICQNYFDIRKFLMIVQKKIFQTKIILI